jgi:hypothetical protein
VRREHHRADPFEHLDGHVVTPALDAEDFLQASLEVGVLVARRAIPQVPLDLDALDRRELTVEVELDLSQHVLAFTL